MKSTMSSCRLALLLALTCGAVALTPNATTPDLPQEPTAVGAGEILVKSAGILVMFFGLALVCDEFFVPALECIADAWELTPDVAGATLMAAGGSAPELFTAAVGTYQRSPVGMSTVVGSAVFNVLFVIGMCIMLQRSPQKLTAWPLARDCICYAIGLATLTVFFAVVSPKVIEWWEALVLLLEYGLYVLLMRNNAGIRAWAAERGFAMAATPATGPVPTFRAGILGLILRSADYVEAVSMRMVAEITGDVDATFDAIDTDGNGVISKEEMAAAVKRLGGGRDTDGDEALWEVKDASANLFHAIDIDGDGSVTRSEFRAWYLRSEERMEHRAREVFDGMADGGGTIGTADVMRAFNGLAGSAEAPTELAQHKPPVTADALEAQLKSGRVSYDEFLSWYKSTFLWETHAARGNAEAEAEKGVDLTMPGDCRGRCVWLLTLPLTAVLYLTVPDVRKPGGTRWRYPAFLLSVAWIGVMSYWMVIWAEDVGAALGIPVNVMGLTVLAAGTSVPDLISSVIVMRQGEGDMALSSSIGSNIFDILVGLPLSWFGFALYRGEGISVAADSLAVSLPILGAMLLFVVGAIHCSGWITRRPLGIAMFLMYGAFVAQDLLRSDWSET